MDSNHKWQFSRRSIQNLMVVVIGILLYGAVQNLDVICSGIGRVLHVLSPFLYGIVWAYVFDIPVTFFEKKLKNRTISIAVVGVIVLLVLILSLTRIVPQVAENLTTLFTNIPQYQENLNRELLRISERTGIPQLNLDRMTGNYQEWTKKVSDYLTNIMPKLYQYGKALGSSIVTVITTIVFCIYVLSGKKRLLLQAHKLGQAFLSDKGMERAGEAIAAMHSVLGKFFMGKLIDSLIIGLLTFICMCLLQIPFSILISIIVGCTNIIPIAGPIIGGIIGAMILILASPQKILVFTLLILVIQQLDGHVIGPKILGGSTGLSTLWVLFAIVVGGSLFGIMGMILGVPVFACLYLLLQDVVNGRLEEKQKRRELQALRDKKVDTVIFDLDGTLLDSLDDLADSVNYALSKAEMPERSIEEIRGFIGNGIHKLIERSVPEGTSEEMTEEVFDRFRSYYGEHYADRTAPYEGIMDLIRYLSEYKIKMAIVSTSAEPVKEALSQLKSDGKRAVYVGDSDVDLLTAQNAGLPCISVGWGYRSRRFLKESGAQIIVSRPEEIKRIVGKKGREL